MRRDGSFCLRVRPPLRPAEKHRHVRRELVRVALAPVVVVALPVSVVRGPQDECGGEEAGVGQCLMGAARCGGGCEMRRRCSDGMGV